MNEIIKEIKKNIEMLLHSGYIYEVRKGVYKGLGINDSLHIELRGELK